ncbi:MAG: ATP-binding cassette domain-containing protein [Acidimicrobiia bacterium]
MATSQSFSIVTLIRHRVTTGMFWLAVAALLPTILNLNTLKVNQFNYILSVLMVAFGLLLVLGYAGQLFLGPGAMFAGGAYTAAYLATQNTMWQPLPMMCLAAVLASLVLATIAALPTLRVAGFYLGLVTLFMAQTIPLVAGRMESLGKNNGLSLVVLPTWVQHPQGRQLYLVGIGIIGLLALYCYLIVNSRLGRRFTSLRAGDELAQAVGVTTYTTKLVAFMLAAVPCGIGGAFYVYSQQFISPGSISPTLSIYILAGMVIGGGGTIIGPIVGAAIVMAANEFLGSFAKYQGIVFGGLLIVVAATLPFGIMGLVFGFRGLWAKKRGKPFSLAPPLDLSDLPPRSEVLSKRGGETLVVNGVSRSFGGVRAVNDVSLRVEPGTVHALVGPNGSGKTTLLNLVCGFYKVDGGEVMLGEHRLDGNNVSTITNFGVGRTFQTPKLSIYDTAYGNVLAGADRTSQGTVLGAVLRTPKARKAERDAMFRSIHALDAVGLRDDAFTMASELSHGTQRLIEISRAIAMEPKIVLLDEPAAGLSVAEAEVLKQAVRDLAASGLGVLLVEHNLPVVFDVADYVTVLNEGEVLAAGSPKDVANNPDVIRVYLGRSKIEHRTDNLLAEVGE